MPKSTLRPPMRKDGDGRKNSYSYKYGYGYGYSGYSREKRPRELNVKLLLATIAIAVVAVPSVYFWHDYQTKKLSDSLWDYGKEKAAQKDWSEASKAFYRVWDIKRDPKLLGDAVAAYDKKIANHNRPELIAAYQRAIGGLPERLDLRTRLAELLVRERQFKSALMQSEKILQLEPSNLQGQKWRALALLGMSRNNQTVKDVDILEELKRAYINQQEDFDTASALVTHIRDDLQAQNGSELATQADGVMNRLIAANPESVRARLLRYQYRLKYDLPGAKRDIEQAVLLDPSNPGVLKRAAWGALRDAVSDWKTSDYLTARQLFKDLINLTPKDESGYLGLGDTEFLVAGNVERAIDIWSQGRKRAGDSLPLMLRIAEGQTNSSQYEQVQQTLQEIDQFISMLSTRLGEKDRNWATASVSLFRGKVLMAQKKPLEAISQFKIAADFGQQPSPREDLRPENKSTSFTALMSLGEIYDQLGRFKDAASSYDRALKTNPDSAMAMIQGAEAWANLGDLDRAIRNIEKAKRLPNPSAQLDRYAAQYLLERELTVPSRDRDWSDFEEALSAARKQLADSWKLRFLEVDYAIHRDRLNENDNSEALGKLLAIEQDFPTELEIWQRLPFVYESLGLASDADRVLNKLESLTSSSVQTKLLTVDLLLGRKQSDSAKRVVEALLEESLSPQELLARDQAMLRIVEFDANDDEIDKALIAYQNKDTKNSFAVERLLDRRLCNASTTAVPSNAQLIEELKQRQPETEATWQYYEARIELAKAKSDITKVQMLVASLTNRLPYWSRTQELSGRIAAASNQVREARIAFDGAVAKPNPNPELVKLLIEENARAGDFLANTKILEGYRRIAPLARTLQNGSWEKLQRQLDFDYVDRGSRRGGKETSAVWSELVGGEESVARQGITGMMFSLWNSKPTDPEVEDLLLAIEETHFDSSDQRAFVLGQAYHLAGRFNDAKTHYRKIGDASERRLQAEIYASSASAQALRNRSREVDLAQLQARATKRLEAVMKLRRAGRNDLEAARVLLESLVTTAKVDPIDRMLLANCFERLGKPDAAIEQLEKLVESDATAYHISVLTDFLLRAGKNDKAQVWIDQLEEQTGWEKKTVLLRSRWMVATNRQSEVKPFVELFATERFRKATNDAAKEMKDISDIYRAVGMFEDAERWLNTLANRFPNQSEPLSRLLVDNDETDRAIQRCVDQLNENPTAETATLLARIMVYGEVSPATLEQVLPLLDACQSRFPDDPSLLFAFGNVHIKLAQKEKAVGMLTRVTELQPGHYLAWNNLAALLAEQDGREEEAMETIEKAIEQAAYEIPTLLDTKAVVLIHQDRFQAAASLLRNDVTTSRAATDPRFYFHLAVSLDALNDNIAAKEALEEAIDLDLDRSFLTDYEKSELDRLIEKLSVESK